VLAVVWKRGYTVFPPLADFGFSQPWGTVPSPNTGIIFSFLLSLFSSAKLDLLDGIRCVSTCTSLYNIPSPLDHGRKERPPISLFFSSKIPHVCCSFPFSALSGFFGADARHQKLFRHILFLYGCLGWRGWVFFCQAEDAPLLALFYGFV